MARYEDRQPFLEGDIKPVSANESDIVFKNSKIRFLLERPENVYRIHSRTFRSFEKFRSSVSDTPYCPNYMAIRMLSVMTIRIWLGGK